MANAASGNALRAAELGQAEASSLRGLGFSREELAARREDAAAGRESTERIAGNDLGFREKQLTENTRQFGEELGFRGKELTSRESQAGLERGSRETIANLDVQSREKLASLELEFRRQGLSSEEARAAAQLEFQKQSYASDLGFKEKGLAQEERQFFGRQTFEAGEGEANRALERSRQKEMTRQFNQQRADAEKAAQQKKKSGLFGFLGSALGLTTSFIPLGGLAKAAGGVIGSVVGGKKAQTVLPGSVNV